MYIVTIQPEIKIQNQKERKDKLLVQITGFVNPIFSSSSPATQHLNIYAVRLQRGGFFFYKKKKKEK